MTDAITVTAIVLAWAFGLVWPVTRFRREKVVNVPVDRTKLLIEFFISPRNSPGIVIWSDVAGIHAKQGYTYATGRNVEEALSMLWEIVKK